MDQIDLIRDFNRYYTRYMALFSRDYVDSGLSVTEIRILREIVEGGYETARAIATDLAIDEGYLSRVIRNFVAKGWISQKRADTDARRKILSATAAGTALFAELRDRTRTDIAKRMEKRDLSMIVSAMERVKTYTSSIQSDDIQLRGLKPGDIGWLTQRHAELYMSDFGYDENFESYVGQILFEFQRSYEPKTHRAFIAHCGHVQLGSMFCEPGDAVGWGKLRVVFVEPCARGAGLGQRLIEASIGFARDAGYRHLELYTLDNLHSAKRLYARNGFELDKETPQRFCGRDAIEERWIRPL